MSVSNSAKDRSRWVWSLLCRNDCSLGIYGAGFLVGADQLVALTTHVLFCCISLYHLNYRLEVYNTLGAMFCHLWHGLEIKDEVLLLQRCSRFIV